MFGALKTRLRENPFARSVTMLAGGTAISHGLAVVTAPLITRLYLPEDMGRLGLFTAFVGTLVVIACARYDVAIVSAETHEEAAALTAGSILIAFAASILGALGLVVCIRYELLGMGVLPMYSAAFAFVMLFLFALFNALRYWLIREEAFGTISRLLVYQGAVRSGVQVAAGFFAPGWLGLLAGELLGRCTGLWQMIATSWRRLRGALAPGRIRAAFHRYRQFPMFSLPSTMIDTLVVNLPLLLIGQLFGAEAAGQFTLVQRLLTIPIAPISASVGDAFHGRAAAYIRDQPELLRGFFLRTSRFLLLAGILPLLAIMILAPLTFGMIFGPNWATAGILASIMAPPMLGHLVLGPTSRLFFLIDRGPKTKLLVDFVGITVVLGSFLGASAAGFDLRTTLTIFSAAYCGSILFYFFVLYRLVGNARPPAEGERT